MGATAELGGKLRYKTFGEILKENDDVGPGFDLLRLALAISILMSHASSAGGTRGIIPSTFELLKQLIGRAHAETAALTIASGNVTNGIPWMRPIVLTHVPMFFALSGFLVMGSAFRTKKVGPFLALRFFRIFPALLVEVVLSAVIIGAIFTTLPLRDYFTSPGFFTYFGNIIGKVQMYLPGVSFNGETGVNANLWTLPSEFYCYLILAGLIFSGLAFNRTIFSLLFCVATALLFGANVLFDFNAEQFLLTGNLNVFHFFVGAMFFHWRAHLPYAPWLFFLSMPVAYGLLFSVHAVYIAPFLITYITIFIGLTALPKIKLLQSGDYSYGIYLYGFPITMVLVATFPWLRNNYFGLVPSAITCTMITAILSWHLVEKRFLRLRRYFSKKSAEIAEHIHPETLAPMTSNTSPAIATADTHRWLTRPLHHAPFDHRKP